MGGEKMKIRAFLVIIVISFCSTTIAEFVYDTEKLLEIENVVPVAVIGGGPAGLSAALYAVRGGFNTTLFVGGKAGGQLIRSHLVENVLGFGRQKGIDIMQRKIDHVASLGVQFVYEVVKSVDITQWPFVIKTDADTHVSALCVIIATGSNPKFLGVPGESEYLGHGVSTCADCDAHFFQDEEVVVVGGGDSAVIYALTLAAFAKKITILHRSGKLRAASSVQRHLKEYESIDVQFHKKIVEVVGNGDAVTHVIVEDIKTEERSELPVQGVFLAIGHTPNSALFKNQITMDDHGYVIVKDRSQHTAVPGVFAAGEVTVDTYRQVIVSEGDGAKAGIDAVSFLHEKGINEKIKHALKLYTYESFVEIEEPENEVFEVFIPVQSHE